MSLESGQLSEFWIGAWPSNPLSIISTKRFSSLLNLKPRISALIYFLSKSMGVDSVNCTGKTSASLLLLFLVGGFSSWARIPRSYGCHVNPNLNDMLSRMSRVPFEGWFFQYNHPKVQTAVVSHGPSPINPIRMSVD